MKINKKWLVAAIGLILAVTTLVTGCGSNTKTTATTSSTQTTTMSQTNSNTRTTISTSSTTSSTTTKTTSTAAAVPLNGAGGTFIAPLATKWFDVYYNLTGVKINYQAVGSGAGINQITAGTVDFGESDGIMTDAQVKAAEAAHGPILHIPMTIGPVAIIYNITGVTSTTQLKLDGATLANIYLKKIKKWNDPAITALNPGVTLPDASIAVVHRSDSSGTTYIFTNYLSKVSTDWASQVGNATSVTWPGDLGGQGSAGVAGQVQQTTNSIGYVELAYALQNNIGFAQLKNSSGNFITPTLESASQAATGLTIPDDTKIMITNSPNPQAYSIVGFTWMLVYVQQKDLTKGTELVNMLWWAIHDGQQYNAALNYPTLPAAAVTRAEAQIWLITYNGKPILNK